jgi:hypothetical protein
METQRIVNQLNENGSKAEFLDEKNIRVNGKKLYFIGNMVTIKGELHKVKDSADLYQTLWLTGIVDHSSYEKLKKL